MAETIRPIKVVVTHPIATTRGQPENPFPRIVLKDNLGIPLNTDTGLQRALYEAKARNAVPGAAIKEGEWRLPHAPLPVRPDYSRVAPQIATERSTRRDTKRLKKVYESVPEILQILEREKKSEFTDIRWTLQKLDNLPAVAGALYIQDQGKKDPVRRYLPFVNNPPTEPKIMSETDKREPERIFPGFCTGCQKSSGGFTFCYGCEQDPQPHYHKDKPVRTGGGFTYYKRDRVAGELKMKNPARWNVKVDHSGHVFYDNKEYPDLKRYGLTMKVNRFPEEEGPEGQYIGLAQSITQAPDGTFMPSVVSDQLYRQLTNTPYNEDDEEFVLRPGEGLPGTPAYPSPHGQKLERYPTDPTSDGTIYTEMGASVPKAPTEKSLARTVTSGVGSGSGRYTTMSTASPGLYKLDPGVVEAEPKREDTTLTRADTKESSGSEKKSRGLYKAPKAFQIKKTERKVTVAKDPFSTDRDYDINTGGNFTIKKSDKALTEFEDFEHKPIDYTEPKKFELQKTEHEPIKEWVPPPKPPPEKVRRERTPEPAPPPPPPKKVAPVKVATPEPVKEPTPPPVPIRVQVPPVREPSPARTMTPDSGVGSVPPPASRRRVAGGINSLRKIAINNSAMINIPTQIVRRSKYGKFSYRTFARHQESLSPDPDKMKEMDIQRWMEDASTYTTTAEDPGEGFTDHAIDAVREENAVDPVEYSDSDDELISESEDAGSRFDVVHLPTWNQVLQSQSDSSIISGSGKRRKKKKSRRRKPPNSYNQLGKPIIDTSNYKEYERYRVNRNPGIPIKTLQLFVPEQLPEWSMPAQSEDEYSSPDTSYDQHLSMYDEANEAYDQPWPGLMQSEDDRSAKMTESLSKDDLAIDLKVDKHEGPDENDSKKVDDKVDETKESPRPITQVKFTYYSNSPRVQKDPATLSECMQIATCAEDKSVSAVQDSGLGESIPVSEEGEQHGDGGSLAASGEEHLQGEGGGGETMTTEREAHSRRMWRLVVEQLNKPPPLPLDNSMLKGRRLSNSTWALVETTSGQAAEEETVTIPNYKQLNRRRRSSLPDLKITQIPVDLQKSETEKRASGKRQMTKKYKSKKIETGLKPVDVVLPTVEAESTMDLSEAPSPPQQMIINDIEIDEDFIDDDDLEEPSPPTPPREESPQSPSKSLDMHGDSSPKEETPTPPPKPPTPVQDTTSKEPPKPPSPKLKTPTPPPPQPPTPEPVVEPPKEEPKPKPPKEIIKKEPPKKEERKRPPVVKKEKTPPIPKPSPEPPKQEVKFEVPPLPVVKAPSPPPAPEPQREPTLPTPAPYRRVEPPPLPRAEPPSPPELPEYKDPEKPKREVSRTLIEAPPPMPEPPKQRRPPPAFRPKRKTRDRRPPAVKQAVAPIKKEDLKTVQDPLDYLAKYCIIHRERLPHYERVFNKVVGEQLYRYTEVPPIPNDLDALMTSRDDEKTAGEKLESGDEPLRKEKDRLTEHEKKMITDLTLVNKNTKPEYGVAGMNEADQAVTKVNYTLDTLIDKYESLQERLDEMQNDRMKMLAELARKHFPDVTDPKYVKKEKKKKKKSKKEKKAAGDAEVAPPMLDGGSEPEKRKMPKRLSDYEIVQNMDDRMIDALNADEDVRKLGLDIERMTEKLRDVDDRIEELEDEKKLVQLQARDEYFRKETSEAKPEGYMRKQSLLFNKMHPSKDVEMNLSELEDALQQINGQLMTEKEMQYIFHILDIPGRRRINVQLFSVIAALSEKVRQVDPFVRNLINKFDFEALDIKMDKSKELFELLDDEAAFVPQGNITARNLGVGLTAGGLTDEHTHYVVGKFNREHRGMVDFMDFLTYVPLFIEIHGRIVSDPLNTSRIW